MPTKAEDIRADVVNGIKPLADRPELRVTDPSFVDPMIEDAIRHGGSDRADVVRSAQGSIRNKLGEPEGLAQIEKLVAAHYANPDITRKGDVVLVDVGVVAGKIQKSLRGGAVYVGDSPNLDRGRWKTTEVARYLQLGIAKYPDASEYAVTCVIPAPSESRPDWKYTYLPKQQLIRITQKEFRSATYVVRNVGPDFSALTSLSPDDFKVE